MAKCHTHCHGTLHRQIWPRRSSQEAARPPRCPCRPEGRGLRNGGWAAPQTRPPHLRADPQERHPCASGPTIAGHRLAHARRRRTKRTRSEDMAVVKVYFDTNVLVAALKTEHPHHPASFAALAPVHGGRIHGYISAHGLAVLYSVLPRAHPSLVPEASIYRLSVQLEVDSDRGRNFDRLAIEQIWLVAPSANGLRCCVAKKPITFNDMHTIHRAVFGDDCLHDHRPLNTLGLRDLRIGRHARRDQIGLHDGWSHIDRSFTACRRRLLCRRSSL